MYYSIIIITFYHFNFQRSNNEEADYLYRVPVSRSCQYWL